MIHELRTYHLTSQPMMQHMHRRMEEHTLPLCAELGMPVLGAWETTIGSHMPAYTWMVGWDDISTREAKWAEFGARFADARRESTEKAGGELVRSTDVSLLLPAPYFGRPLLSGGSSRWSG
jgi:hypothetical protein